MRFANHLGTAITFIMASASMTAGHHDSGFKLRAVINIVDRWVCDPHFCKDRATFLLNTKLVTTANS